MKLYCGLRVQMKTNDIQYGKYQHYRTEKLYEVIGIARHSETYEEMVIYKALYECDNFGKDQLWVRPKTMFFEHVSHNGSSVPRFKWIDK
jgi:hypothetical protein